MIYYVSKYALSGGIIKANLEPDEHGYAWRGYDMYRIGRDVHETREAAEYAAEQARVKKISSLKKQIAKLEKLTFSSPDKGEKE